MTQNVCIHVRMHVFAILYSYLKVPFSFLRAIFELIRNKYFFRIEGLSRFLYYTVLAITRAKTSDHALIRCQIN